MFLIAVRALSIGLPLVIVCSPASGACTHLAPHVTTRAEQGQPQPAPKTLPQTVLSPSLWFVVDRDVIVRGALPSVGIEISGPRDASRDVTTGFEVIAPDGALVPRHCENTAAPLWSHGEAITLDLTCHRLDRPGLYTIRVNPAKLGLSGTIADLPIRVLADAPAASSLPANWTAFAVARVLPSFECFGYGESYRVVAEEAGVQILVDDRRRRPVTLPDALRNRISATEAAAVRHVFPWEEGWLVTWNHGEWGGGLDWYARSGDDAQPIVIGSEGVSLPYAVQNVNRALAVNGDLYVLQGISHLTISEGQFAKVWRYHGHFRSQVIARYASEPVEWIRKPDGTWLVATWDAIWKTSESGSNELVARLPGVLYYPNSLAETPNGTLYIGTRTGVLRLTPTWSDAPLFAADFLLPKGSRYEACWQSLAPDQK